MEPLCSQLLLRQKEGRQTSTSTGLPTTEQVDEEEPQCVATNSLSG